MWRVVLGTILGIYLAQTYKLPNIRDKAKDIEAYLRDNRLIEDKDDEANNNPK